MDRMIGTLLRTGVILAAIVTLIGGIWHYSQKGEVLLDYRSFRGEPPELRTLAGVVRGIAHARSECLMQLGLLLLIATPIARVALSVVAFAIQRDRTYVAITLLVLSGLIASLAGFKL